MLTTTDSDHKKKASHIGLEAISLPVKPHLQRLDEFMGGQIEVFEQEIQELVAYCLKNSGKRIRPILLFCSGWRNGVISEDLIKASAVIEFVHLATLVHDDILDQAILRHNDSTVSKKFGPEVAVLLGDALFAQALKLASDFPTVDVCRAVSESTRRVCAGEIGQSFQRGNANISVEDYFRIITYKTAELFYVSCSLGAQLAGRDTHFVKAVGKFGRHLGIAYQIFDDLTDLVGREDRQGKTLGTDIAGGKFTLPLILLWRKLDRAEREALLYHIRRENPPDIHKLKRLITEKEIAMQVGNYFKREIETAEQVLLPFSDYLPVGYLWDVSNYIKAKIQKLC